MAKTMFVWLGSGRTRKFKVGESGQLLDQAARAGLPVPAGAIVLDSFYRIMLKEGLARHEGQVVLIDDPGIFQDTLFHSVRLPRFERPVTLYPIPAHPTALNHRPICLNVDLRNPIQTARAFEIAWGTDGGTQIFKRYDTIILEMVEAIHTGTATLIEDENKDHIRLKTSEPNEHGLWVGEDTIALERLKRLRRPDDSLPPFARRLQMLLRGIRRTFNNIDLYIEWADDGSICWINQIIPFDSTLNQVNS
jgi:hypothetical protein